MKSFAVKASLTIVILYGGMLIYRYVSLPYFLEGKPNFEYTSSESAQKEDYMEGIQRDEAAGLRFAENFITAYHFNMNFPFDRHEIVKEKCAEFVNLYTDSSNFLWGETTSEYTGALVFYDSLRQPVALVKIDEAGPTESFPYLSLMKWGYLNKESNQKLQEIIRE